MDESLSDFQEPRKNLKSTYTGQKHIKPVKARQNRKPRPKGQKDIRSILKAKKSDIIKYTEDFNSVCQQSGLDVDSEQLQIAIALSKSEQVELKDNSSESQESVSLEPLDSQERTKKIRTTLLEYGFKVPEVKINFNINKKIRKFKKDSKLLKITDEERQQKISIKYAQVLFNNLNSTNYNQETSSVVYPEIYSKASDTKFESLKNDSFFMIDNLLEKSTTTIGSLLKDWSKIPGRPQSPCFKIKKLSFVDLSLSQSELDVLLSGTFSSVKKTLTDRQYLKMEMESSILESHCRDLNFPGIDTKITASTEIENTIVPNIVLTDKGTDNPIVSAAVQHRSCSPDIFEDESLCIVENTPIKLAHLKHIEVTKNDNIKLFQSKSIDIFSLPCSQKSVDANGSKENITKRVSNDFMDLTECVAENILPRIDVDHAKKQTELAHDSKINNAFENDSNFKLEKYNDTNQNSDDYMEITECVNSLCAVVENQNSSPLNDDKMKNVILTPSQNVSNEYVDLTKNDNHADDVENVTIIYECESLISDTFIKLKPERDSNLNKLPYVEINSKKRTIEEHIDLTQESRSPSPIDIHANNIDNFVYDHSDQSISRESENVELETGHCNDELNEDSRNKNFATVSRNNSRDDSEHASNLARENSSKVLYMNHNKNETNFINKSALCDGFSIEASSNNLKSHTLELHSQETTSSQSSYVVFEISDEELDYSIHACQEKKSTCDEALKICDDGDNVISEFNSSHNNILEKGRTTTFNRSFSDSCLPVVEIKGTNMKKKSLPFKNIDKSKSLNSTPVKTPRKDVVQSPTKIETPKNSDYIVKTSEVTPILDYETLSTPERIKELDKYGLKPFKRKRAIQILKHLYNQTHPIMENLSDDNPSPSKIRKINDSPLKNKSPNKQILDYFPIKKCTPNKSEKENIFAITNDVPVIKEIDCHPDDWVFQKRTKAKVHTCKVPLHIAFHNYVSSRYGLQEAILQYQPIEIDIIHKELAEYGHKYDPKSMSEKQCRYNCFNSGDLMMLVDHLRSGRPPVWDFKAAQVAVKNLSVSALADFIELPWTF
ncbi:Structure-specific endonuclease subunit SLX4 [Eumeta japonica]|uniref:Structure-specific endonuclease subunit SLX4 n=1 Tax=Eumeta variegata TaxID=151549 RepID=A0A4C1VSK3_EUMVA|nr:Structure-specific endonuclease subunit SLX4 [Eumeta japonica]